jgi:hypothetical protein
MANKVKNANLTGGPPQTPKQPRESLGNTTGDPKRIRTEDEHDEPAKGRPLAGAKGRRTTRQDAALAPMPVSGTFEESININPDPVLQTAAAARELLEKALYLPPGIGELTTSQLANAILLWIATVGTNAKMGTHVKHLRAIAILLHHEDTSSTAQLIASRVADIQERNAQQIETAARKLAQAIVAAEDATAALSDCTTNVACQVDVAELSARKLTQATSEIKGATEEMKQTTVTAARQQELTQEATQELANTVEILTETSLETKHWDGLGAPSGHSGWSNTAEDNIATACAADRAKSGTGAGGSSAPRPQTQKDAQRPHAPENQPQAEARAKALADECNVILDIDNDATESVAALSEQDLVNRATAAIDRVGIQAGDKPEGFAFVAATKLAHGSIRYRMTDRASADWLKKPDVRVVFADTFGGGGHLRDKAYAVIIEYASTEFDPTNVSGLEAVARLNGIPGGVASARWLKKANKRRPGQRAAFLEMALRTPKAANTLIQAGCVIHGRTLRTRKKLTEPRCCMKCNCFTSKHMASTCRQEHNTCAWCGGEHRADDCTIETAKCINCSGEHAAYDRWCPRYLTEVEKIRGRVPDNRYPLYPKADNPLTWVADNSNAPGRKEPDETTWRTVGPRRGRQRATQQGHRAGTPRPANGGSNRRAPSMDWEPTGGQPRSRARSALGTDDEQPGPSRDALPLRQRTLHEVSPLGVLPSPQRRRSDSSPAKTPMSAHA